MLTNQQEDFLRNAAPAAVESERDTGLPASLTLSQAIFESAWGLRAPGNNLFGVKADAHGSGVEYVLTHEYLDGTWEEMPLAFETYNSVADCFIDHARLITQGQPYAAAWAQFQADGDADALARSVCARYATAPSYAEEILAEMHSQTVTVALATAWAPFMPPA